MGTPGFKPPGVCFCSARQYRFRGDYRSWCTRPASLLKGLLDAVAVITGP